MSGGHPPGFPPGGLPPPGSGGQASPPPGGAVPPGYGPPLSYESSAYGAPPPQVLKPGAIKERNPVVVLVLSVVTCNIYYLFWLYATSRELKDALQDDEIKPGIDLLLALVSCSLWSVYIEYRNARKVYAALRVRDPSIKDQTDTILMLDVAGLFVGVTWLVATYILQEDLNKLARY